MINETESSPAGDSSDEDHPSEGRPSRGRKRKVAQQSRADRKRLLNLNEAHINTRGDFVEEKVFNTNFNCSCSKKCTESVPLRLRKRLFSQFWSIGTFEGRCAYLLKCVSQKPKNRICSKTPMKNRVATYTYSMFGIVVCKTAFLKTLQINASRMKVAFKKDGCDTFKDLRGQAVCGWNKLPSLKTFQVRNHINSFPKYISHYCRSETDSKFLHPTLNLELMYRLYREKIKNPASKSFYKKVFYRNFNLRFKVPEKDTCKKCDHYLVKIKSDVGIDLQITEERHNEHLARAQSLRLQLKDDLKLAKTDDETETLTFDMQKTLALPKLSSNIVYYLRQLNLYNFGIHVGSTGSGIFNVWLEYEASKGTQEVGSCLVKYIQKIEAPVKNLILWSDSCGGQNRSIKLVLMLVHCLQNHSSLQKICLRFLESGHSFLPNDSEFGDVERVLKKHASITTLQQYVTVMENCRKKNKFFVNRMLPEEFFSVETLTEYTTNRKKDIHKTKINWMETHEIVIEKSEPLKLKMKKDINGRAQIVNIEKKGCPEKKFKKIQLKQLWPEGRVLSSDKVKDLKSMMFLVEEQDQHFYSFLENVESCEFSDDVEGFGEAIDFNVENDS